MHERSFTVLSVYLGIMTVGSLCGCAFEGGTARHDMCPSATIAHLNAMAMAPWRCHHYVSIQLL